MFEVLRAATDQVRSLIAGFEPARFDGAGARSLVEAFGELERLAAAGKALAARQVVATGAWKQGARTATPPTGWRPPPGRPSVPPAATLDTVEHLESLPCTEAALRAGRCRPRRSTPSPMPPPSIRPPSGRCWSARRTTACAGCATSALG